MEAEIVISSKKPQNEDSSLQELVRKDTTETADDFQKTYVRDNIYVAHKNALSFLKEQKKNSIDLILTDPPYVISRKTGGQANAGVVGEMDFGSRDHEDTFQ